MRWTQWDDEQGTCYNSGTYMITQRDGGRWLLEGPSSLYEERGDLDLLKMLADDHAERTKRTGAVLGAISPAGRPEPVDLAEWPLDINELRRIVKRMSKVVHTVNPYTERAVSSSRDNLAEIVLDLQRVIDRLP